MKKQMNYILILVNILILVFYSSEIKFMPNYSAKPDKWYLMFPFLSFTSLFAIIFIVNIFLLIRKTITWIYLVWIVLSVLFFLMLNVPDSLNQNLGYFGIFFIICIMLFITFAKR